MFFSVFIFLFLNESTMTYHKNIEVCKQLSCSITDVSERSKKKKTQQPTIKPSFQFLTLLVIC